MDPSDVEGQGKDGAYEIENVNSYTPEEEQALVRKVDLTLLPTIWIMYLLSYLDRTKSVDTQPSKKLNRGTSANRR